MSAVSKDQPVVPSIDHIADDLVTYANELAQQMQLEALMVALLTVQITSPQCFKGTSARAIDLIK